MELLDQIFVGALSTLRTRLWELSQNSNNKAMLESLKIQPLNKPFPKLAKTKYNNRNK